MDAFCPILYGKENINAEFFDQTAFDEKFEIEPENDFIRNLYHIENKYMVPVMEGGFRDMFAYCSTNLIHPADRNYDELMDPDSMAERFARAEDGMLRAQFRHKLVDGSYRWVRYIGITGEERGVPEGKIYFYIYDIQNQMDRLEGRSHSTLYQKGLNPLTGLRTPEDFFLTLTEKAAQNSEKWCCVAVDIQHFTVFNAWFGHEQGDYLLSRIGSYLSSLEKTEDAVAAYFGRDNFAVFLRHDPKRIEEIYRSIRSLIFSHTNVVGFLPALGVYVLKEGEKPGLQIYDNAHFPLEEAKKDYTDRIRYFDSTRYEKTRRNFQFLTDMQKAIREKQITFYLQPQCRIGDGKIVGVEALARWVRSDGTVMTPGSFIPFLEADGFITELDKHIWNQACQWLRGLMDRGFTPLPVSINVSQIDLLSMDVAEYLYALTRQHRIEPEYIKVEITESAYAENYDAISEAVTKLKKRGFTVYLDDFGAGYSSLNLLDKINVDLIKLDMLFIKKDTRLGKKGISIVESIFGMSKMLGLPVIVEGVENEEQLRFLKNLGCRYAQGYYFHKPMPIEAFEQLLMEDSRIDHGGLEKMTSDFFRAQEFLRENMFTESTLNRILGAVAYYALEGDNITITRFNGPFRSAIGDTQMDHRIVNIQNFVVPQDHPALYGALRRAEQNTAEGGRCEIRFIKSDDSIFWFRMQFYFLHGDENRKLFFGQVEDITGQREQTLHFFDVLRKQADVTMCIELDRNRIQYVTGENTLYQPDLPSTTLDYSVQQTVRNRIPAEEDRQAFLHFFDKDRLREAYNKAIYHEVLTIVFRLQDTPEPVEFSTYSIRYSKEDDLIVYAFAKRQQSAGS